MQIVNGNKGKTYKEALLLEKNGQLEEAAAVYRLLYKHTPKNKKILNRLIIIYRKLKDVVNEINFIDAAIRLEEQYFTSLKQTNKKAISLSKQLNLMLGHTDKRGNTVIKTADLLKLEVRKKRLTKKRPIKK